MLVEFIYLSSKVLTNCAVYGTDEPSDELLKDGKESLARPFGPDSSLAHDADVCGESDQSLDDCAKSCYQEVERPGKSDAYCYPQASRYTGKADATVGSTTLRAACHGIKKGSPAPITPLRPSRTQAVRELAFGASDEELSEIEDHVLLKPHDQPIKDSKKLKTPNSRVVVGSDEGLPSTPTRPPVRRSARRNLLIVSDGEDEIEEVLPASNISSTVISRRRSVLTMAPVLESHSGGLPGSHIQEGQLSVPCEPRSAALNTGKRSEDVGSGDKEHDIFKSSDDNAMLSLVAPVVVSGKKASVDVSFCKGTDARPSKELEGHERLDDSR
jgi:hypothetical protein